MNDSKINSDDFFDGPLYETDSETFICYGNYLYIFVSPQIHNDKYFVIKVENKVKDKLIKSCNILFESSNYSSSTYYKLSQNECNTLYNLLLQKPDEKYHLNFNTNWEALVATHNYENDDDFHGEMPDYRLLK